MVQGHRVGLLMLPEGLVTTCLVLPILLHEVQDIVGISGLENTRDVLVLAAFVAVLSVASITIVWPGNLLAMVYTSLAIYLPKTMYSPRVTRSRRGICVPELYLENLALDFSAASIGDGCSVVAAQNSIRSSWTHRRVSQDCVYQTKSRERQGEY